MEGIVYSLIARKDTLLVSAQLEGGDFEQNALLMLPTISSDYNSKTSYTKEKYMYHVNVQDQLIYMCVSTTNFGRRIPYAYLQEIRNKFSSGSLVMRANGAGEHEFDREFSTVMIAQMEKFNREEDVDHIGKLKHQVKEVKDVMSQNIEKVLERGDRLDTLLDKTNELEVSSSQFKTAARKVRRKMFCQNVKMWMICFSVAAVILTIIVLMATNIIPVKGSNK